MRIVHAIETMPIVYTVVDDSSMAAIFGQIELETAEDTTELCQWLSSERPIGISQVRSTNACYPSRQFWVQSADKQMLVESRLNSTEMREIRNQVAEHFGLC